MSGPTLHTEVYEAYARHNHSMPDNRNSDVAQAYHNATKHSYASVRNNPHFLDFENQPLPFKIYPTLQPSSLPSEVRQTGVAALSAISEIVPPQTDVAPDLEQIAQLLYLSAGITRHRKYPGGEIYFRAAACTGALYEVELYLVCADLSNLEAGVYHFAAAEFGLRKLRAGDYRSVLDRSHRRRTRHRSRPADHRLHLHLLAQRLEVSGPHLPPLRLGQRHPARQPAGVGTALGLPAKVVSGFADDTVNSLLDVDPLREVAFSLVPLGHVTAISPQPPALSPLGLETVPLSRHEIDYPLMREMHAASSLQSAQEISAWRGGTPLTHFPPPTGKDCSAPAAVGCGNPPRPDRAGDPASRFEP